jgi:ABC-type transport system involved in cytochrome bd biosynthesis fused ATPase/permease subunit
MLNLCVCLQQSNDLWYATTIEILELAFRLSDDKFKPYLLIFLLISHLQVYNHKKTKANLIFEENSSKKNSLKSKLFKLIWGLNELDFNDRKVKYNEEVDTIYKAYRIDMKTII